jgi:hypothetical protein
MDGDGAGGGMLTVGFGEGGGEVLTDGEGAGCDVLTLGRGVGFGEGLGGGDGLGDGLGEGAGGGGGGGGAVGASLVVLPGFGASLVGAREVGVDRAVVRRWVGLGRSLCVGAGEGDRRPVGSTPNGCGVAGGIEL